VRKFFLTAAMTFVLLLTCVSGQVAAAGQTTSAGDAVVATYSEQTGPAQGPVIKYGDRGADVKRVQKLLADSGFYPGALDGVYGGGTVQAVKSFQTAYNLPADGIVGRETIIVMERATGEPDRYSRSLVMTATAYTSDDYGCGDRTSRGHALRRGLVAVDPRIIPMGSRLYIQGYGYAIADDVGSAIRGNRIDLAFETLGSAMKFGRRQVTVYIID
jgi:3D (Asp-Asp-Asp) domain-containing protein